MNFVTGGISRAYISAGGSFIAVGSATGSALYATGAGTAAAPAISFGPATDTGFFRVGTYGSAQIGVTTSGVERMRFTASGNVGINTTTPTAGTLVVKNINDSLYYQYQGINDNGNTNFLFTQNPAGDAVYNLYKNTSGLGSPDVQVSSYGVSFFNGGNVGIGITVPTAVIDLSASTTVRASLRIRTGVAPTTPNDGDIWQDGTDLKIRIG